MCGIKDRERVLRMKTRRALKSGMRLSGPQRPCSICMRRAEAAPEKRTTPMPPKRNAIRPIRPLFRLPVFTCRCCKTAAWLRTACFYASLRSFASHSAHGIDHRTQTNCVCRNDGGSECITIPLSTSFSETTTGCLRPFLTIVRTMEIQWFPFLHQCVGPVIRIEKVDRSGTRTSQRDGCIFCDIAPMGSAPFPQGSKR